MYFFACPKKYQKKTSPVKVFNKPKHSKISFSFRLRPGILDSYAGALASQNGGPEMSGMSLSGRARRNGPDEKIRTGRDEASF